jgi:hypothetical protein
LKRLIAVGILAAIGVGAMAQTCVVTNESLTTIDDRDTFAGEMRNDSGVDILHHRYRIAFLNSNNAVVETMTVDGCLRSLQDGASDFFSARSSQPDESTTIALARLANFDENPEFEIGQTAAGDVELTDGTAAREDETLTVSGTITNSDDEELEDPAVCVVVWNEDGRVVTTARVFDIVDLEEGQSADFEIDLTVPADADLVASVDLWADGLEDNVPVAPESQLDIDVAQDDNGTASPTSTATTAPTATPAP